MIDIISIMDIIHVDMIYPLTEGCFFSIDVLIFAVEYYVFRQLDNKWVPGFVAA